MLPHPALTVLIEYISDTQMGVFISLAQVNRASRAFFLSDYAWKRFDVHRVQGQHNVYKYGYYQLKGIAAHYYNWLCSLHPSHRRWHMPYTGPSRRYTVELYDQLNFLARLSEAGSMNALWDFNVEQQLLRSDGQVWRCWELHPLPEERTWYVAVSRLPPLFINKALYLKINFCIDKCLVHSHWIFYRADPYGLNPYQNDREVNLTLAQRGLWYLTSDRFRRDVNFLLEALSGIPEGSFFPKSWYSPNLLNELYKLNIDKAVEFVSEKPSMLADFSEDLRSSEQFIFACVRANPKCLLYAGKLRNDRALVGAAIDANPDALQYAPKLQNTREIVELAVAKDPRALRWASMWLRDNSKLVKSCTDRDPEVLRYASYRVRLCYKLQSWRDKHFQVKLPGD